MKYLFDFDGTLTHIVHEYNALIGFVIDNFAHHYQKKIYGNDPKSWQEQHKIEAMQASRELMDRALRESAKTPKIYGFTFNSRVSAFGDEDPYARLLAGVQWLDKAQANGDFIDGPFDMKNTFSQLLFDGWESLFQKGVINVDEIVDGIIDESIDTLNYLLAQGAEVSLVTNSACDRVLTKCEAAGLYPKLGRDYPDEPFKLYPNAKKFDLGETPDLREFAGRKVDVNRPKYRKLIENYRPDVIVGDVFSLDLSVPLSMALDQQITGQANAYLPHVALIQRTTDNTWAMEAIEHSNYERAHVIQSLRDTLALT